MKDLAKIAPAFVYVVVHGTHESTEVTDVFASAKDAMKDNPIPENARGVYRKGGWQPFDDERTAWWNGLDWEESCMIYEYEVK